MGIRREALRSLQEADVLVYTGAGLEPWVNKVVAAVGNPRLVLVEASRGITLLPLKETAAQDLKSVFADEVHGQRVAQAVARELGTELVTLHSLACLTEEQ